VDESISVVPLAYHKHHRLPLHQAMSIFPILCRCLFGSRTFGNAGVTNAQNTRYCRDTSARKETSKSHSLPPEGGCSCRSCLVFSPRLACTGRRSICPGNSCAFNFVSFKMMMLSACFATVTAMVQVLFWLGCCCCYGHTRDDHLTSPVVLAALVVGEWAAS